MKFLILVITVSFSLVNAYSQDNNRRIVIETDTSFLSKVRPAENASLIQLQVFNTGDSTRISYNDIDPIISGSKLKWTVRSGKPVLFTLGNFFGFSFLVYPGDSVHMSSVNSMIKFTGKGSEKCQLMYDIDKAKKAVAKPVKYVVDVNSMDEYLLADKYYDEQLAKSLPLIDAASNKISKVDLWWIKCWAIEWIEWGRLNAFTRAANIVANDSTHNNHAFSMADVHKIWDTTQFKQRATWLRQQYAYNNMGTPVYFYFFNRTEVWLKYDFNMNNDSLGSKPIRTWMYYAGIKKNYKGLLRERVLNYLIDEQVITEMGSGHKMTRTILKDYYGLPGFLSYKQWIKKLEAKSDAKWKDNWAPAFELVDTSGKIFTKNNLRGKIAVLDFWFTGCKGCSQMANAVRKVEDRFRSDTNIVFISVSTDAVRSRWLKSIKEKKYTCGTGIQLYTGGAGFDHPMIKQYDIQSYPSMILIDPYDKLIITYPPADARVDDGKALVALLQNQLVRLKDGPYVMYTNNQEVVKIYSINANNVQQEEISRNLNPVITSATDDYSSSFQFRLQKNLSAPPVEYPKVDKLLVLSDIEGNFSAFRKLLQNNGVMDSNYNWTFGSGHLVFAGDMFDRGEQVPESLWLIYSLEEKAKAQNGYVHFILGNHETMNLQGNHKYTLDKYKSSARLLGSTVTNLYSENTELGRWLRTKNIVEKIGELLILHGGISSEVNKLPLSLSQINQIARPYYADQITKSKSDFLRTILSFNAGPLWYRNYYSKESKANERQIDSTLQKFDVKHIITGHTIVADTISIHFGSKVINTDTHHAIGKSEALLIEGSNYYRVNGSGQKWLLFSEDGDKRIANRKNNFRPTEKASTVDINCCQ